MISWTGAGVELRKTFGVGELLSKKEVFLSKLLAGLATSVRSWTLAKYWAPAVSLSSAVLPYGEF